VVQFRLEIRFLSLPMQPWQRGSETKEALWIFQL